MHNAWYIEFLGKFQASLNKTIISKFRTQKTASLLAYIIYYNKIEHSRDSLIDIFWPENDIQSGRHNLSQALSSIRSQFNQVNSASSSLIISNRNFISFNKELSKTDVGLFKEISKKAFLNKYISEQKNLLSSAVELYKGHFLNGFYDDWAISEREHLQNVYIRCVNTITKYLQDSNELSQAIELNLKAISIDPLREELHQNLMQLYDMSGQYGTALKQYESLKAILKKELGVLPDTNSSSLAKNISEKARKTLTDLNNNIKVEFNSNNNDKDISKLQFGVLTFIVVSVNSAINYSDIDTTKKDIKSIILNNNGFEIEYSSNYIVAAFPRTSHAITASFEIQSLIILESKIGPFKIVIDTNDSDMYVKKYYETIVSPMVYIINAIHDGQVVITSRTLVLINRDKAISEKMEYIGNYKILGISNTEKLFLFKYFPSIKSSDFPQIKLESAYQINLPFVSTKIFGREIEIETLYGIITSMQYKIITLTGSGGVGKTRLVIEIIRKIIPSFNDNIWFIPLHDLKNHITISEFIVDSMKIQSFDYRNSFDQIIDFLKGRKHSILIFDNYEHLIHSSNNFFKDLLYNLNNITCIVTSRFKLDIDYEFEFPIKPLSVASYGDHFDSVIKNDCVQLFRDRAISVKPDFSINNSNIYYILELCKKLDGIPLAIELAAARAQVLTPKQMLEKLKDRFDFLVSKRKDISERHRTLRAVIDSSYQLLDDNIQKYFAKISIFNGDYSLESAEIITEEKMSLDYLSTLKEYSFVYTEEKNSNIRFRMFESVKEYAKEQLFEDERKLLQIKYAKYYVELSESYNDVLLKGSQITWLDNISVEMENIRYVFEWIYKNPEYIDLAVRLSKSIIKFWQIRCHYREGIDTMAKIFNANSIISNFEKANGLMNIGILFYHEGELNSANHYFNLSMYLFQDLNDKKHIADLVFRIGNIAFQYNNMKKAKECYQKSYEMYAELNLKYGISNSINGLANIAMFERDYQVAYDYQSASLLIRKELKDEQGICLILNNIGRLLFLMGNFESAKKHFESSIIISRNLGAVKHLTGTLSNIGLLSIYEKDFNTAEIVLKESLALKEKAGEKSAIASLISTFGLLEEKKENYEVAINHYCDAIIIAKEYNQKLIIAECLEGYANSLYHLKHYSDALFISVIASNIRKEINVEMIDLDKTNYQHIQNDLKNKIPEKTYQKVYNKSFSRTTNEIIDHIRSNKSLYNSPLKIKWSHLFRKKDI